MDYSFLEKTTLFRGISAKEIETMLTCFETERKSFKKGEAVYNAGDIVKAMGIVYTGSVNIENNDIWGNKSILAHVSVGQIFAETYAVSGEPLMVSAVAAEDVSVLFVNMERLLNTCDDTCNYHRRLIRNLLFVFAQKNLNLSRRSIHTSSKSIRGRLVSYLSYEAVRHGSCKFEIPFNRQQLSDYLGVDRSALSNELSKMKRSGLLNVNRNSFYLNREEFLKEQA